MTTQSRPAREYAHSDSHRTFLCSLSMSLNLTKSPLFALCIFQASSFSQTPLQHARPGRGSLGGRVGRDASPSGDCNRKRSKGLQRWGRAWLDEMLPRQGIATHHATTPISSHADGVGRDASPSGDCNRSPHPQSFPCPSLALDEMLPRQGIATSIPHQRPRTTLTLQRLDEMLPRQGIATPRITARAGALCSLKLDEMLPRQRIATPDGDWDYVFKDEAVCWTRCFPVRGLRPTIWAPSGNPTGFAKVGRDASPSGDCDLPGLLIREKAEANGLHEMLPRQGIAT